MAAHKTSSGSRALAELQYNSILSEHTATSSEDESPGLPLPTINDAPSLLGVSIGREQTRLTSPSTPAAEKVAAINRASDYFANANSDTPPIDESPDELVVDDEHDAARLSQPEASIPVTTPTKPAQKHRSNGRMSMIRDGLSSITRRRAASGPATSSWSVFSSFSSMSRGFSGISEGSASDDQVRKRTSYAWRSNSGGKTGSSSPDVPSPVRCDFAKPPEHQNITKANGRAVPKNISPNTPRHSAPIRPNAFLRRTTSDTSLVTQRTVSRVSSLGDDARFEHISDQVNSRFKAIKDSLQDSKISLPSMPSITNFQVANFTPDFLYTRAASTSLKQDPRVQLESHVTQQKNRIENFDRQPEISSVAEKTPTAHPHFNRALEELEGDVVVLGGYRGSILRSAEPPHRQLWVPIKVGLNLRKVDLEVSLEEDGDERATEKIIPGGMLTHIGPVDISRRLLKRLRNSDNARAGKLRVHEYGYDWRLHPAHLSTQLLTFLQSLPSNQPHVPPERRGATVVAHSLGGLITRHAVNRRPDLFAGVVYAGVPTTCVNILGPMRNGDEVLLSSRVLTAQVNFTIRTSYALLPLSGRCFIDKNTKEEYPLDFFDPQTWIDYRLSPCVAPRPLPSLSTPQKSFGISGYVNSALDSLPIPGRKSSKSSAELSKITAAGGAATLEPMHSNARSPKITANGDTENGEKQVSDSIDPDAEMSSARTAVTIPREKAIEYLTRTLASVKKFKEELAPIDAHNTSNSYPPLAVIYGKNTPTLIGAKVHGREGIKYADAYDELAFSSGDGVVLARAAMVPEGYRVVRGGIVSSDRGHVTLLGDLEAVGKCLHAVIKARKNGVGRGPNHDVDDSNDRKK
jgi:hypothetical protein